MFFQKRCRFYLFSFNFLRFDPTRHLELFDIAANRAKPEIKLNLSIVEARNLASKDISGVNDAFCTFYLKSR